jgi:hypothetical protein
MPVVWSFYFVTTVVTGIFGITSNDLWNPLTWQTIPVSWTHLKFAPAHIVSALVSNSFRASSPGLVSMMISVDWFRTCASHRLDVICLTLLTCVSVNWVYAIENNPPPMVHGQTMYAHTQIPNVWLALTCEVTNPLTTRYSARSIMTDVMVMKETMTSATLPYKMAKTSGYVKILFMPLIFLAKMMPIRMRDSPSPTG